MPIYSVLRMPELQGGRWDRYPSGRPEMPLFMQYPRQLGNSAILHPSQRAPLSGHGWCNAGLAQLIIHPRGFQGCGENVKGGEKLGCFGE